MCTRPEDHLHPAELPLSGCFNIEVADANTASVVSGVGIPIVTLTAGSKTLVGKSAIVNQSQLDKQQPNIRDLVATIE